MSNWSERLDDRLRNVVSRLPAPPLWLLAALQLIALILIIVIYTKVF